ncbi:hypothetical protein CK203_020981 [Vitis vinifera]|uniref:Uncharacterized protein n=1 Tax=Vitis vinifera TaxID=29760 RepID=A0A438JX69_VITVI|nr:hypothetical protein CK203_020981 [Vitis vinifera]
MRVLERKTVKVLIERKTFLIRLEGDQGGEWCSMTEISRGLGKMQGSSVGSWLQQSWKVHKDLGVATNRKPSVLIIPEGDKGREEKGRNLRGESWPHYKVGSMHRSYAKIVSDEGPRGGGLVPVGGEIKDCNEDRAILPAMLEVTDGDWVFTVVVVVVGDEERRRGSEKGESTRVAVASHMETGGGRRGECGRSTEKGRYRVGEDNRLWKEENRVRAARSRHSLV